MIWCGLQGDGTKLPLVIIGQQKFNSDKYLRILEEEVLPTLQILPRFQDMTFQQVSHFNFFILIH